MSAIADNLQAVQAALPRQQRLPAVAGNRAPAGRQQDLAAGLVLEAADAGQRAFGENYVQEGVDKIAAISGRNLEWHFIGPLQSNKTSRSPNASTGCIRSTA
jgi:hypothetical protein